MNKTVIAVVVVVLVGLVGYFMFMKPSTPGGAANNAAAVLQGMSGKGSFADIAKMGGTVKCDVVNDVDPNTKMTGTTFMSNGKMRSDFSANTPAGAMEMHMISDGEFVYSWNNMTGGGFKMPVPKPTEGSATNPADQQKNPYAQEVSYNCAPWTPDASLFELPQGVTFSDMSAMMPGAGTIPTAVTGEAGVKAAGPSCAMCDQAPAGDARAACRAALGCK